MKLTLSNFQIHQKPTTLEIPEGETTYVEGESDIGKSSRLRAMRWLCENKPDGGSFVTFKQPRGTNARVMLECDGRIIMRERGKSTNLYKMDGETFEAFGRSVPEPISKFLALSPYAFQCQGEVPFLIGASPTEAAKILSEACGLGVIDTAVQFVRGKKAIAEADIRKSEILLESAQQRLTQATESLPLADALEAAARVGDDVEELAENVDLLTSAIDGEPTGALLDVGTVRGVAATAHTCEVQRGTLTAMMMTLCGLIRSEPVGTLLDVTAVRPSMEHGYDCSILISGLGAEVLRLRRAIDNEPTGALLEVPGVRSLIGKAGMIDEGLGEGEARAERLRRAIQMEPTGDIRDVTAVIPVARQALAALDEAAMLGKMVEMMRGALQGEPQGVLLDTTELKQQRAQIKVCATCGREM